MRRDERRGTGGRARTEHGHVDPVVRTLKRARHVDEKRAYDLDGLDEPPGANAWRRVADAGPDGFVTAPPRAEPRLESTPRNGLHLQCGLCELDGGAEQVVGEGRRQKRTGGRCCHRRERHPDVRERARPGPEMIRAPEHLPPFGLAGA